MLWVHRLRFRVILGFLSHCGVWGGIGRNSEEERVAKYVLLCLFISILHVLEEGECRYELSSMRLRQEIFYLRDTSDVDKESGWLKITCKSGGS
jgi:hypothetical protein